MAGLVDVPDVDHGGAGGAERVGEERRLLDHAVLACECRRAGRRECALLADRVVLQVDDEEGCRLRVERHPPNALAISAQVPTVATFCIA